MNDTIGDSTLKKFYLYENEKTRADIFKRVCKAASLGNTELEDRLYSYLMGNLFMFATPILANLGTTRGLPISCFVNQVEDSREGIFGTYMENFWLGSDGGGIGTDWSFVRSVGEEITHRGTSSGVIPFIKVSDSTSLAVSQGGLRRASQAVYLDVRHPEIIEFIDIRKDDGADKNRRSLNVHHAVKISDDFMQAVLDRKSWDLVSPKTGKVVQTIDAFDLWAKILTTRMERGEPYIFFTDNINAHLPESYKQQGKKVTLSNLCTEILQYTDNETTAICALGSINLANWDVIKQGQMTQFFEDIVLAMDNVLEIFIKLACPEKYKRALKAVTSERNIGIGVMGWHTYLQKHSIPFESTEAALKNRQIFKTISEHVRESSVKISGSNKPKNTLRLAIAPTSSISLICGEVSAGIEPLIANVFTHKTGAGSFIAKNKELDKILTKLGRLDAWKQILQDGGSVQNLDFLDEHTKAVFKTAFEISQAWILEHAEKRQEFIDQGQSLNLFLPNNVTKRELYDIHMSAWKRGLKTLYYLRSSAPQKVGLSKEVKREVINYDECLSCQ